MLACSEPRYHRAREALTQDDEISLREIVAGDKALCMQSFREERYSAELCCSRADLADLFFGADRCVGGGKAISLCCGDYYCHAPFFLCILPLLRFPVYTYEYVAVSGEEGTLLEAALRKPEPKSWLEALGFSVTDRMAVNLTWVDGDAVDGIETVQVYPFEKVNASIRRQCGMSTRDKLSVVYAGEDIPLHSAWEETDIQHGAMISLKFEAAPPLQELQILEARYGWWADDVWATPQHKDPKQNGFKDVTETVRGMMVMSPCVAQQLLGSESEMTLNSEINTVNDQLFKPGVLHTIGTDFGSCGYTNPSESDKVKVRFSSDANNYYSTAGGHRVGDSYQAASVICSHKHPGKNATMWSKGAPEAWFIVDLVNYELCISNFAYRNDYGGGGNHPIDFELQASNDGNSWTTLQHNSGTSWAGVGAKAWPVESTTGQYYRMFKIQNKGTPNHLCCSGIEFYGQLKGVSATTESQNAGELHLNPGSAAQWMNQNLWPETASGPPIPRRFAVRYRYGDSGNVMELVTRAVPNETYAVTITPTYTEPQAYVQGERPGPEITRPPMVLVNRGSINQCVFANMDALKRGETCALTLSSHPGAGIGLMYPDERRFGPWRYIESSACPEAQAIRAQYQDGNYLMSEGRDLVFDVSFWKMEVGNTVNFVGGTTAADATKKGGGGRDWVLEDNGTIAAKHHRHLVLGFREV